MRLHRADAPCSLTAAVHAEGTPRPGLPAPDAVIGPPLWLPNPRCWSPQACVGCPAPAPDTHGRVTETQPPLCIGRYAGTAVFLGRRGYPPGALPSSPRGRRNRHPCVVPPCSVAPVHSNQGSTRPRLRPAPGLHRRKKIEKSAHRSSGSLDKRGPHTGSVALWLRLHVWIRQDLRVNRD